MGFSWQAAVGGGAVSGLQALIGHKENRAAATANAEQMQADRDLQRTFAQMGIQWKVEDAKKAGISPLAALGMPGASYTPVSMPQAPDNSLSNALGDMGQNVHRAIQNTRSPHDQEMAKLQLAAARADLDGRVIDNQIKASQLQNLNSAGPGIPSPMDTHIVPGQRNATIVRPSEVVGSSRTNPGIQAGMINTLQYTRETNGNIGIAPSKDAKERNEDDLVAEAAWHLKNRVMPPAPSTEEYPLPKHLRDQGYKYWLWNPFKQEFVPSKNK